MCLKISMCIHHGIRLGYVWLSKDCEIRPMLLRYGKILDSNYLDLVNCDGVTRWVKPCDCFLFVNSMIEDSCKLIGVQSLHALFIFIIWILAPGLILFENRLRVPIVLPSSLNLSVAVELLEFLSQQTIKPLKVCDLHKELVRQRN